MLDQLNKYKGLLILIGMIGAGYMWFTPMSFAEETRQIVEEIRLEIQLKDAKDSLWDYKKLCTNLKTGEWLCSQDDLQDYEQIQTRIKILEKKMGIGGNDGTESIQ